MIVAESVAAMPYFPSTTPSFTMTVEPAVPVATPKPYCDAIVPPAAFKTTPPAARYSPVLELAVPKPKMPPRLVTLAVAVPTTTPSTPRIWAPAPPLTITPPF